LLIIGSAVALAGGSTLWSAHWGLLVSMSFLCVLTLGWSSLCEALQIAARLRVAVALHQVANSWLRLPIVLACLVGLGGGGSSALLGYSLASGAVLISQYFVTRGLVQRRAGGAEPGTGSPEESRAEVHQQLWTFGSPFVGLSLLSWLQLYSDRWILQFSV